jgi:hypothetical protein
MAQQRALLEVVELDARIVPSVTKGPALVHAALSSTGLHAAVTQAETSLSGTGSGTVSLSPAHVRGGGTLFVLRGTADLTGLGTFKVTGGVIDFKNGTSAGTLVFTGASGSITLVLTSSNQSGHFNYQISHSTIAGLSNSGTLTLALSGGHFNLTI